MSDTSFLLKKPSRDLETLRTCIGFINVKVIINLFTIVTMMLCSLIQNHVISPPTPQVFQYFFSPVSLCRQRQAGQGSVCWLRSAQHAKPWRRRSSVSWRRCRGRRSGWSSVSSPREPTGARLWRVFRKHAPTWCTR